MCLILCYCMIAENSSPYSGVVGLGAAVDGASPGLPLAVPAEPNSQPTSHTGSPDPTALTVLQPSNGASQHYSTMLPSFGYSTGIALFKGAQVPKSGLTGINFRFLRRKRDRRLGLGLCLQHGLQSIWGRLRGLWLWKRFQRVAE